MKRTRPLYAGLLMWALVGFPLSSSVPGLAAAHAEEAMSKAVGEPLKQAAASLKAGKFNQALTQIQTADAVPSKTASESFAIDRMRLSALLGMGNGAQAAQVFEKLSASGKLAANEKLADIEGLVGVFYRANDFKNALTWANNYVQAGGTDPRITTLGPTIRFKNGDYAGVAKELMPRVQADEKAGRAPSETTLQLLANCYINLKDENNSYYIMERLVQHYPQKSYWTNVVSHVSHTSGFSDHYALDLYRLKFATDTLSAANEYKEYAKLANIGQFNVEAKKAIDQAYANKVFGAGPDAAAEKRLMDEVAKDVANDPKVLPQAEKTATASADGTDSINLGLNYITGGQVQKGLPFVDAGVKKGNFKNADDAKLSAGIAYALAGQKAKAVQVLKGVQGADGAQSLARLWTYRAQQ